MKLAYHIFIYFTLGSTFPGYWALVWLYMEYPEFYLVFHSLFHGLMMLTLVSYWKIPQPYLIPNMSSVISICMRKQTVHLFPVLGQKKRVTNGLYFIQEFVWRFKVLGSHLDLHLVRCMLTVTLTRQKRDSIQVNIINKFSKLGLTRC